MAPISAILMHKIPNQIPSKPIPTMTGKRTGNVTANMPPGSMNIPRNTYRAKEIHNTAIGGTLAATKYSIISVLKSVTTMKRVSTSAMIRIIKIIRL